jgi:hypothetical protein
MCMLVGLSGGGNPKRKGEGQYARGRDSYP